MNTITLEFKSVKTEIPIENLTLDTLEEAIFDIGQQLGQTAFVNALGQYDAILAKSRLRGELKNIRKKTKYLQTRIGDICYRRTLYREKTSGKLRYLLDEALKIDKNQRLSLKMTEIVAVLACIGPYRAAQEHMLKLMGLSLSHEAIRQNVIREGKRIEEREAQEHRKMKALDYPAPQDTPDVVYNETDTTYIRKQNRNKKKERKQRHLEVKLGVGYTGKEPRYNGGKKKSRKLSRKIVYADIRSDRNEFMDKFSCISEKEFGLSVVKDKYLGSDGDAWIREGAREYFPGSTHLLCPFHLFRNLRRALPGKKRSQQRLKKLFEQNRIDKVLVRLKRMIKMIRSRKPKKNIAGFYAYVRNNRQGIEESMRIRLDKNIQSAGAVEPNIDKLIAHRFKGRGLSWSLEGAQALLKIRQTIANGQWDDWWYDKRGKHIEIKAVFKQPLTAKEMTKHRAIAPFIEMELPCYRGPDQSKPWVGVLHKLTQARQLS